MGSSLPKGLRKEVLSPAAPGSRRVRRGDSVTVECQGSILGGPKFWSTKDPGQVPLTFPCGLGKVSPAVSDILMCGMIIDVLCDFAIVCCVRCCIFNIRISLLSQFRWSKVGMMKGDEAALLTFHLIHSFSPYSFILTSFIRSIIHPSIPSV